MIFLSSCHGKKPAIPSTPVYPIQITEAATRDVPIFIEALGHVDSITSINIFSRVEGELTGIYVPEPVDEAMRDLIRARFQVGKQQHRARQQLKMYLLRHNLRYGGQTSWSRIASKAASPKWATPPLAAPWWKRRGNIGFPRA